MIASLRGTVLSKGPAEAVIECAGVGYACAVAPGTLATLRRGEEATLLTEMVVRDDGITLFGFGDDASRAMFRLLQTVSGLGPQMAFGMIAALPAPEIATAIATEDAKTLCTLPRVGKKMASRLMVELKDKVEALRPDGDADTPAAPPASAAGGEEVTEALQGLGFSEKEALAALAHAQREAGEAAGVSALLRRALSYLGKGQ